MRPVRFSARSLFAVISTAMVILGAANLATAQAPAKKSAGDAAAKLDLNQATAEQMAKSLPGVGEVTAKKIVEGRPFKSVEDLARVGIPTRTIEGLRSLVIVSGADAPSPSSATAKKGDAPAAPKAPSAKINLNTATESQLQELPGIGPARAREIIAGRPYKDIDDLAKIKGLGKEKIEELRALAVTSAASPVPAPSSATAPSVKNAARTTAKSKAGSSTKPTLPARPINLNTATKAELEALPEIGPVKAQAIIEYRAANKFKSKEEVMKVTGVKEGIYAKIKDYVTVD